MDEGKREGMPPSPGRSIGPASWAIRSIPRRLAAVLVSVEILAIAVVLTGGAVSASDVTTTGLWTIAVLAVAGMAHTEAALGVERMRRRVDQTPHMDLSSVWTFAAALLLPGCLATAVVLLVYLHLYLRAWRPSGFPVYRVVFSTATVVLAAHAAGVVVGLGGAAELFRSATGLVLLALAVLAYGLVNLVLVVAAIRMSGSGTSLLRAVGHRDELVLELTTLTLGAVVAAAVSAFGPALAVLVLPPLVVLHRTVLVRQLEEAASTDAKTGLLNAESWRLRAELALRAARHSGGTVAVLLLDIDHFKLVNDRYGHLAGDQILADIGAALRAEVRDHDLVGRFGGEEFVVLLTAADVDDLRTGAGAVADRIRCRIDDLRPEVPAPDGPVVVDDVSVSVGVATFPADGADLDRLIEVADAALYAAKAAGRNLVRHGLHTVDDPSASAPRPAHGS
ncbi:sensor domain-containing diguanylate cyclase [Pseudonocardia abyssalis]|uniref:GGDEF domain-containing protein n=1 Tax=Pseudonocardia abyssalis TaxID=2792008 RepID=A0ABS6UWY8_9PSEU|nr:GGDEF domain-containing protein [Pseudonocardia abyssalis]MBW0119402.1 GGDEF domain-containing protein [Pseudonocardia abyssalis]MBW0136789.1 GGDEF domain-containing protein [Pseudonocardia abyssalis]